MDNDNSFHYTYSAAQRAEVEEIRKKYLPPQEDKMARLRQLDSQPLRKAQAWSLTLGILCTLIFGTGMSLILSELGAMLGGYALPVGIAVGAVGLAGMILAWPVYSRILEKERQRIAPEILRLTEELME